MSIKLFGSIFLLIFLLSCGSRNTNKEIKLKSLVALEKLEKVTITNNYGTHILDDNQVKTIKAQLSDMTYEPDIAVKVGAIHIELIIDGEKHNILTATHGNYIEVHKDIVGKNHDLIESSDWLYFNTGGVNFDNYKKEEN